MGMGIGLVIMVMLYAYVSGKEKKPEKKVESKA